MNMQLTRRTLLTGAGAGLAISSLGALGFGAVEAQASETIRPFKLTAARQTRNTCPYCSVSCGIIMYSQGDGGMNAHEAVFHIEGDPDHPINRGTLCPKGSALLDFVNSGDRTKYPMYRAPGSDKWERKSWDWTLDRIARLMKEDRDKNFIAQSNGVTVNRWTTTGFLGASAATNETAYITWKVIRSAGALIFDNQARV
jgi:formate dehydrogenase major subunit